MDGLNQCSEKLARFLCHCQSGQEHLQGLGGTGWRERLVQDETLYEHPRNGGLYDYTD